MNRKTAIAIAAGVYVVLGLFLTMYLAGWLFFLLNKSMPQGVGLETWWLFWQTYSEDPQQRKYLQAALGIAAAVVYLVPLLAISALNQKSRSLHGDARFATQSEVNKSGLLADKGIIVGKFGGRYLMFDGQEFVLLAAPTRSGKGVAVVLPNLLNYSDSVVVLDIKLENFRITSGFRAAHGQEVYLFSPFAEDRQTHCWNPLDEVSRDANFRVGDLQAFAHSLWPKNPNDKDGGLWQDQASNLFVGLALYCMETPGVPVTLGEILRQSSGKGLPVKDYLLGIIAERSTGEDALSDECLDALNRFCAASDNTLASILSTFNAPLTIFASPVVDAATSRSDFTLADVRRKRMSIYFGVQPNRLESASLLINLFFSQLINLNTKELPQGNPELKYQCLLLLDEFTAMGKVGVLSKGVSFIAGYNLRLLPIIQSVAQLESVYGKEDARTFATNHAIQILYPPREQKDANEYSEMLGYFTERAVSKGTSRTRGWHNRGVNVSENVSEQRRALMLPQELKELGEDKEIIIKENTKPILAEKARYFADPVFVDRLKAVSPSLAALGKKLPSKEQMEDAALVRRELSAPVPELDLDLHRAKLQGRTRELGEGEEIDLAKLALNVEELPELDDPENPSDEAVEGLVDAFFAQLDWTAGEEEAEGDAEPAFVDTTTGEVLAAEEVSSRPPGILEPLTGFAQADEAQTDGGVSEEWAGFMEPADDDVLGGVIEPADDEAPTGLIEPNDEPGDEYFDGLSNEDSEDQPRPAAKADGPIDLAVLDDN